MDLIYTPLTDPSVVGVLLTLIYGSICLVNCKENRVSTPGLPKVFSCGAKSVPIIVSGALLFHPTQWVMIRHRQVDKETAEVFPLVKEL